MPWKQKSKEIRDLGKAEEVLNEDHFGLEKIKERILEYLAVRQLVKNPKGSILCFVGPSKSKVIAPSNIGFAANNDAVNILDLDDWYDRRGPRPVANDVPSIHRMCFPIFDTLDQTLVVYIHGSFARNLQTYASDINLYIPSHSRKQLELFWSASPLRKPRIENPSVGELLEEHLRDEFGREVTICCSDDPWVWVRDDIKFLIYPPLEGDWEGSNRAVLDKRTSLLQAARKSWYLVQRFKSDEAKYWQSWKLSSTDSDIAANDGIEHLDSNVDMHARRDALFTAINRLYVILASGKISKWRKYVPELTIIPALLRDLKPLLFETHEAFYIRKDEPNNFWETTALCFRDCAVQVSNFHSVIFARVDVDCEL